MPGLIPGSYQRLVSVLNRFNGIGSKAAERMTRQLLLNPEFAQDLIAALGQASTLVLCPHCRVFIPMGAAFASDSSDVDSSGTFCNYCSDAERHSDRLLVVLDEQSARNAFDVGYKGQIWLLHQLLSPIDRIGPDDIDCSGLLRRLQVLRDRSEKFKVLLLLPDSVEGRATTLFLQRLIEKQKVPIESPERAGLRVPETDVKEPK